ncbi:hypothetical protein DUI87_04970 [Hirundo rustica rustica]|uniref:ribonuclease H n=1 Tax=Hirundo rustica rustica TaxID=333673 RepID=A0A3M0KZI6_HIRRU|nr:hypothetical protein DUI87_04970 [Hirundo rustica rustica]
MVCASLLSPVRATADKAIIHHYMDDVLCVPPNDDVLSHALDLTINSLIAAGFELQEEKVQRMPPWPVPAYLGLEISKRDHCSAEIGDQKKSKHLADLHQLCGALNWVRPWLGLTTEDLAPLFDLLKGGEELSSPRVLTPEAKKALERVQDCMSTRQAHRYDPGLPFKFIIMGRLPHLHGVIFQWRDIPKKDRGGEDPLLIIEWVFLSHQRSKRMIRPQELLAELIRKARSRIRDLAGCDFECIYIPTGLRSGPNNKSDGLGRHPPSPHRRSLYFGTVEPVYPKIKLLLQIGTAKISPNSAIQKRDLSAIDPDCDSEIVHWSKPKGVAVTIFLPWVAIAKALVELAHLECWVAKQANLTTDALTNLLGEEETTRQATLQNRADIDYLLLLHGHRCEEFEGLCCFNLTSKAENIHDTMRRMKEMVTNIKRETDDWLNNIFSSWGLSGWVSSIIKTLLLCLFILMLVVVAFGLLKKMLYI